MLDCEHKFIFRANKVFFSYFPAIIIILFGDQCAIVLYFGSSWVTRSIHPSIWCIEYIFLVIWYIEFME